MKQVGGMRYGLAAALMCVGASLGLAQQDPAPGAGDVFEQKRCAACHSLAGAERPDRVSLAGLPLVADPVLLGASLWNHAALLETWGSLLPGAAGGWPRFEPGELGALAAELRAGLGTQPLYLVGSDPGQGTQLYRERCQGCHQSEAEVLTKLAQASSRADVGAVLANHVPALVRAIQQAQAAATPGVEPAVLTNREAADLVGHLLGRLPRPTPSPTAGAATPSPAAAATPSPAAGSPPAVATP